MTRCWASCACVAFFSACGAAKSEDASAPFASCRGGGPGVSSCGASHDSCCTALPVPGGTYLRSYDSITFTDDSHPATVSSFQLDKYEVTVGRFRPFVAAVISGWAPAKGAGKHGNGGLNGGSETGWDPSWSALLPRAIGDWNLALECGYPYGTWTPSTGTNESLPINCETWYEAYAFCIWDGGFLPTEAEWNYAAAGGAEQRVYPWSTPPSSTASDYTDASYNCLGDSCSPLDILAVGSDLPGVAKWGHMDLGGNVAEWNLDVSVTPYPTPCNDCAALTGGVNRSIRGGGFTSDLPALLASARDANSATMRNEIYGIRCARVP